MSTWTEERVAQLLEIVGDDRPVSQEAVAAAAEALEVSTRSVSSKLRKMGEEVEKAGPRSKKFSDEDEARLVKILSANPGAFTYAEVAEELGGDFTAKQVQGKILSLELTDAVKPTPKKEVEKTYTEAQEAKFISLAQAGAYLEDIAEALGKTLASVRGKALSLNRTQGLEIPKQRDHVVKVDALEALGDKVADMTVAQIAEAIGKTPRGVRAMITRRNLSCADYKAKAKKAEAA